MIGRQAVTVNNEAVFAFVERGVSSSASLFQCVLVYKITSEVPFLCFVCFFAFSLVPDDLLWSVLLFCPGLLSWKVCTCRSVPRDFLLLITLSQCNLSVQGTEALFFS